MNPNFWLLTMMGVGVVEKLMNIKLFPLLSSFQCLPYARERKIKRRFRKTYLQSVSHGPGTVRRTAHTLPHLEACPIYVSAN